MGGGAMRGRRGRWGRVGLSLWGCGGGRGGGEGAGWNRGLRFRDRVRAEGGGVWDAWCFGEMMGLTD